MVLETMGLGVVLASGTESAVGAVAVGSATDSGESDTEETTSLSFVQVCIPAAAPLRSAVVPFIMVKTSTIINHNSTNTINQVRSRIEPWSNASVGAAKFGACVKNVPQRRTSLCVCLLWCIYINTRECLLYGVNVGNKKTAAHVEEIQLKNFKTTGR